MIVSFGTTWPALAARTARMSNAFGVIATGSPLRDNVRRPQSSTNGPKDQEGSPRGTSIRGKVLDILSLADSVRAAAIANHHAIDPVHGMREKTMELRINDLSKT